MLLNRQTKILLRSSNIWYFGEGMLGPLLVIFSNKIGGNILDISQVWATYLIATGCLTILVGKIPKKILSTAQLMIAGYGLNTICTFAYLLVSSQRSLLLVQIGLGMASALATPTWNALYAKYERRGDPKQIGYVWALADGQTEIVTGIAIILGGLIINFFSFQILFIIMGCVQFIATICVSKLLQKNSKLAIEDLASIE